MRYLLLLLNAVCLLPACQAQPAPPDLPANADEQTLLWEISGNGLKKPSYLFGTFHLMCRGDIRISPSLRTALGYADEVYMEMDMDDPAVLLGGLLLMRMKDGRKLRDLYTETEYQRLLQYFTDTLHAPMGMLESTKPYFLLMLLYPKMMPCKQVSGMEEELVKMAKAAGKPISGLETIEFQASVFDSIPYAVQARELLKSIDSLPQYAAYFDTMQQLYKDQQLDALEAMLQRSEAGMAEYQPLLLDQRNERWVQQLKQKMVQKSLFTAVGAGHLMGENGLIRLLRKENYRLRPLLHR